METRDNFATLAASFLGKDKAKPQIEKAAEIEQAAPEPEKPYQYGYTENNNHWFTDEERLALSRGEMVRKANLYGNMEFFFTAPYDDNVRLISTVMPWDKERKKILPKENPKYRGFLVGTDFYADMHSINEKLIEDVERRLHALIPSEEEAQELARGRMTDDEAKKIEAWKAMRYDDRARTMLYEGREPTLTLYKERSYNERERSADEIIGYIVNHATETAKIVLETMNENAGYMYGEYVKYNRLKEAYERVKNDDENEDHIRVKIARCVKDEKTVRIELANGNEVRVETRGLYQICTLNWISVYHVNAQDRQYLNKDDRGRPKEINLEDIVRVKHGKRVLFERPKKEQEPFTE